MTPVSRKLARARYLLRRLTESPPSFLARKASIELHKRLDRRAVLRAAREDASFSNGYELEADTLLTLSRSVGADWRRELEAFGGDAWLAHFAADFDARRFRCLGYGTCSLEVGAWSEDEFHDYRWPREYFAEVDFVAAGRRCDVKVPWEKSRWQWLVRAAIADALDGDTARRAARLERIELLLEDWLAENPYGIGVNWVSAMEVALRAVNGLAALTLLADRVDPELRGRLIASLGEHLHYLRRYPETSDVQGNHYLATELGLFWLEAFRRGPGRSEHAAAAFVRACHEQFDERGLHVEFAPIYHRLSLDMVLAGACLMERVAPCQARQLDELVARAEGCCRGLASASGELPLFADHDSGHVLDLGQPTRRLASETNVAGASDREARGIAASLAWQRAFAGVAAVDGRGSSVGLGPKLVSGTAAPSAASLGAGPSAAAGTSPVGERSQLLPTEDARPTEASYGPFHVLERGGAKVVLRAGPHGLAERASHDHEDQLSIWYSFRGRDLLVEAGCPPYTRDAHERELGISAGAHNVVALDDRPRFRAVLGSVCSTVRGAPVATASISDGRGEHPTKESAALSASLVGPVGAQFEGCPARHERRVTLDERGALTIVDRLRAHRAGRFESRLHVPPGVHLESTDAGRVRFVEASGRALAELVCESDVAIELECSHYDHHPEYGAAVRAERLCLRGAIVEACELRFELVPLVAASSSAAPNELDGRAAGPKGSVSSASTPRQPRSSARVGTGRRSGAASTGLADTGAAEADASMHANPVEAASPHSADHSRSASAAAADHRSLPTDSDRTGGRR